MYERLQLLLSTLDEAALNWSPGLPETNSIAVLVAHTVGATARWLSNAAGDPRLGDRPAEFRTRATPADAIALIEKARADARTWLTIIARINPEEQRPVLGEETSTTVAWCVEHALTHAHEHWGQIQLTHQLAEAAIGTKD
jgi:hypothetical protein